MNLRAPGNRPTARVRFGRVAVVLTMIGGFTCAGTFLAPACHAPLAGRGVGIALNIAGVSLSARVSLP
jgi:hypothetical protein